MNITDWIDRQLDMYTRGLYGSFAKTCRYIATHKNIELVHATDQMATFEMSLGKFSSRMTIKNTYKYKDDFIQPISILRKVAAASNVNIGTLKSKWRKREVVEARMAYMILAKHLTSSTIEQIGELVNRDHCTVLYALKQEYITNIQSIINRTKLLA